VEEAQISRNAVPPLHAVLDERAALTRRQSWSTRVVTGLWSLAYESDLDPTQSPPGDVCSRSPSMIPEAA